MSKITLRSTLKVFQRDPNAVSYMGTHPSLHQAIRTTINDVLGLLPDEILDDPAQDMVTFQMQQILGGMTPKNANQVVAKIANLF